MSDLANYLKSLSPEELKQIVPKLSDSQYKHVKNELIRNEKRSKLQGKYDEAVKLEDNILSKINKKVYNFTGGVLGAEPVSSIRERQLSEFDRNLSLPQAIGENLKEAVKKTGTMIEFIPTSKLAGAGVMAAVEGGKSLLDGKSLKDAGKDALIAGGVSLAGGQIMETGGKAVGTVGGYLYNKAKKVADPAIKSEVGKSIIKRIDPLIDKVKSTIKEYDFRNTADDINIGKENEVIQSQIDIQKGLREKKKDFYNKKTKRLDERQAELEGQYQTVNTAIQKEEQALAENKKTVSTVKQLVDQIPNADKFIKKNGFNIKTMGDYVDKLIQHADSIQEQFALKASNTVNSTVSKVYSEFKPIYEKLFKNSTPIDVTDEVSELGKLYGIPSLDSKASIKKIVDSLKSLSNSPDVLEDAAGDYLTSLGGVEIVNGRVLVPAKVSDWFKRAANDASHSLSKSSDKALAGGLNQVADNLKNKTATTLGDEYLEITARYADFKDTTRELDSLLGRSIKSSGDYERIGVAQKLKSASEEIGKRGMVIDERAIAMDNKIRGITRTMDLLRKNNLSDEADKLSRNIMTMAKASVEKEKVQLIKKGFDQIRKDIPDIDVPSLDFLEKQIPIELYNVSRELEEDIARLASKKVKVKEISGKSLARIDGEIESLSEKIIKADSLGKKEVALNLKKRLSKLEKMKNDASKNIMEPVEFKGKDYFYVALASSGYAIRGMTGLDVTMLTQIPVLINTGVMLAKYKPYMAKNVMTFMDSLQRGLERTKLNSEIQKQLYKYLSVQKALLMKDNASEQAENSDVAQ